MVHRELFPLADYTTVDERADLGEPNESLIRAVRTGDVRQVQPGEWYISGATPAAYRYPGIGGEPTRSPFAIARLVAVDLIPSKYVIRGSR